MDGPLASDFLSADFSADVPSCLEECTGAGTDGAPNGRGSVVSSPYRSASGLAGPIFRFSLLRELTFEKGAFYIFFTIPVGKNGDAIAPFKFRISVGDDEASSTSDGDEDAIGGQVNFAHLFPDGGRTAIDDDGQIFHMFDWFLGLLEDTLFDFRASVERNVIGPDNVPSADEAEQSSRMFGIHDGQTTDVMDTELPHDFPEGFFGIGHHQVGGHDVFDREIPEIFSGEGPFIISQGDDPDELPFFIQDRKAVNMFSGKRFPEVVEGH